MSGVNGAHAILQTLAHGGVDVCFTNPGTSEMHLVAGMDAVPEIRGILCLFEGVATGAADGYGRMVGRPASTLLHLGPGLGNGLANLHNARRAGTPILNIVGDHATYHKPFDAPLESDIDAMAWVVSKWVRRSESVSTAGPDTAEAIAAARCAPSGVATLVLPADVCWSEGANVVPVPPVQSLAVDAGAVEEAARILRDNERCVLLLGGDALRRQGLEAASRVAAATGAKLLAEESPARHERGAGIPRVGRLAYLGEHAAAQLAGARYLVLAGARSPVSFFAYPGKPSDLVPEGCAVHNLGSRPDALEYLADLVASGASPVPAKAMRPGMPSGELTAEKVAAVIGALLPEGAIVTDEAVTSGRWLAGATTGSPPHDWLTLTGGAIGQGMPLATGAAIACPDRPVISLEADGSAMYTLQALWTQSREGLDVTTVIFSNASYAILGMELQRVGAGRAHAAARSGSPGSGGGDGTVQGGETSKTLLELPGLDFVALANGMGVPATRAKTAEEFTDQLRKAIEEPGPHLIDAVVPPLTSFSF